MPLTDTTIRKAKPDDKNYKLADSNGLYLLVKPNGGKYWRFDYRFDGRRKTLALGVYPTVSLKKARDKLYEARQQIDDGIDPSVHRRLLVLSST